MVNLFNNDTGMAAGSLEDADCQVLVDACEEESSTDQDYYITMELIDSLADGNAPSALLDVLRAAVGDSDGVELRWEQE